MEEQRISDFNDAAAQMQRLHNLYLKCENYREQGLLDKYENVLSIIESELKYDGKIILEKKDYISKLNKVNKNIKISNSFIFKTKDSMFYGAALCKKWTTLIEKEELLREIQQESGKGGRYRDPYADEGM